MSTGEVRALPDVERALAWVVAGFDLLYAATLSVNLVRFAQRTPAVDVVLVLLLVLGPLALAGVQALRGRATRPMWTASAACYLIAIATWPLFLTAPLDVDRPSWLAAMLIPATLQVLMAARSMLVTSLFTAAVSVYLASVGALLGGLRVSTVVTQALMIAPFALILAAVVTIVRGAARRAAAAHRMALQEVAAARFEDVTEAERVRTDALVHDTILTTLLQAASAERDDETERARRMAANALRVIAHVSRARELGSGVRLRAAVTAHEHRLEPAIRSFEIVLDDPDLEDLLLPAEAADALLTAMTEAMDNSVRHAEADHRTVRLRALGLDGVRVDVDDDGRGFDYPAAAGDGIRDRIMTPMLLVEGRAELASQPGDGTSVRLSWGSVTVADVRPIEDRVRAVTP